MYRQTLNGKSDLKHSGFVPFWTNLTHFGPNKAPVNPADVTIVWLFT